jgi:hypothetical protein
VRAAILARLKSGVTQVVCNCGVLTEGFDEPSISCVVVARPTSFHGLYVQMVGRGTRLSPGKMNLLVIDVVGATKRHDLISVVDLGLDEDGPRKKRDKDGERQACPACGIQECQDPAHRCVLCHRYLPARLLGEGATRHENCDAGKAGKVNVFGESRLTWLPVGPGWCLSTGQDLVVMVPAGSDTWKLINYAGTRIETLHEQLPVDWAMGIGEDRAKAFQKLVERGASWRRAPVRTTQIARLISDGFPEGKIHLIKTRGEASDLITRIKGRKVMRRLGVSA